jgi:hypothetical protein
MDRSAEYREGVRKFSSQRLVDEVNRRFEGFHFSIQTFRPDRSYADRVQDWFAAKARAENRGLPFDDSKPVFDFTGPATFDYCAGEERESGLVLKLSMKAEPNRSFTIFIEEKDFRVNTHPSTNIEASIADHLAFWTEEMICGCTIDELDGRAVGSRKWLKTWTSQSKT